MIAGKERVVGKDLHVITSITVPYVVVDRAKHLFFALAGIQKEIVCLFIETFQFGKATRTLPRGVTKGSQLEKVVQGKKAHGNGKKPDA